MLVAETAGLRLRHLTTDDAPFIVVLLNDAEWLRFIGDKGVHTIEDAAAYIMNGPVDMYRRLGFGLFLVELVSSGEPIGLCGLIKREGLDDVDLGFAFLSSHRKTGVAYEAAHAVIQFAERVLALKRIVAITTHDNERSSALLKRLGFSIEGLVVLPNAVTELRLFARSLRQGASR